MTTPLATYRLQLHKQFTMFDAAQVAPYLAALGVSHVYLSPILQSAPGSTHGYDGVDPERIDEDRGGDTGFAALCRACEKTGLKLVLDIVPNHLDVNSGENRWWRSVLEKGPESEWANAFDIDWDDPDGPSEAVLAPVLGERLPRAIEKRDIRLERTGGDMHVRYFDHTFPLSPESVQEIVDVAIRERGEGRVGTAVEVTIAELLQTEPELAAAIDQRLEMISDSPDDLRDILEKQHYQLAFWRRAATELNYRRFFDINTLIGVRVEDEAVFDAVHQRVIELARTGMVEGLRVDHPDGLREPKGYFERLAARVPKQWLIAEKILERDETIRRDWPIDGTTGYDFLNVALGALIDQSAEEALTALYREVSECRGACEEIIFQTKWAAARELLVADLLRLVRLFNEFVEERNDPVFFQEQVTDAIALMAACAPVYRTYIVPERNEIAAEDVRVIDAAFTAALRRRPDLAPALERVRDLLQLRTPGTRASTEFVARFQQYSAPTMAKGVEDTAFYRFHRFVALNEVGGDPNCFGVSVERFHQFNRRRAERWPGAMNATATHDTKRGEDVRARLAALSEMPDQWAEVVQRWRALIEPARQGQACVVSGNTEYLLYQTVVGAWPIERARLEEYMIKAAREAKEETSWVRPNQEYEESLLRFVGALYENRSFLDDMERTVASLRVAGRVNGLAQTLWKFTCPGVPDLYQGCEWWDLSLVDPDNRRPVDFQSRAAMLKQIETMAAPEVWATLSDADDRGVAKMWLTRRALLVRRERRAAFERGSLYRPLVINGPASDRVVGFVRATRDESAMVAVVTPRLNLHLPGWEGTVVELHSSEGEWVWRDCLDHRIIAPGDISVGELLNGAPVALFVAERR